MLRNIAGFVKNRFPAEIVEAHCDGPCGVYDPSSARIAGEAALSMTKKILDLSHPDAGDSNAMAQYLNTMSRYVAIKEQEAHHCKEQLLVLWTDFFKPAHLEAHSDLHETFWNAAKLCSAVKVEVNLEKAQELMGAIEKIHGMFWGIKDRDVAWVTAS